MPEYKIYYSFTGYGHSYIEAENEEEARTKWNDGECENEDDETENYEITDIEDPEEIAQARRRTETHGIIDNNLMSKDEGNYCRCGNPVEEKGETCDQCWAKEQKPITASKT